MRNLLMVLVSQVGYWVLDDVLAFIPDKWVETGGKLLFKATRNEYRFAEFQAFWNKKPE